MSNVIIRLIVGVAAAALAFFAGYAVLALVLGVAGIYIATWGLPFVLLLTGVILAFKAERRYFAVGWMVLCVAVLIYFALTWK